MNRANARALAAPAIMEALESAQAALEGDSNDDEHDALLALVDAIESVLTGEVTDAPTVDSVSLGEHGAPSGFKMTVSTYNGKWLEECPGLQEFDEPEVPVLVTPAAGVRIVLGTHDYHDFERPDIQIERRHNGWIIFLHPVGGGDASGFVVFLDDGHSYVAPEGIWDDCQIKMVDYEQATAQLDEIKPDGLSCRPSLIVESNARKLQD